jgi:hypothetical protein
MAAQLLQRSKWRSLMTAARLAAAAAAAGMLAAAAAALPLLHPPPFSPPTPPAKAATTCRFIHQYQINHTRIHNHRRAGFLDQAEAAQQQRNSSEAAGDNRHKPRGIELLT